MRTYIRNLSKSPAIAFIGNNSDESMAADDISQSFFPIWLEKLPSHIKFPIFLLIGKQQWIDVHTPNNTQLMHGIIACDAYSYCMLVINIEVLSIEVTETPRTGLDT